MGNTTGAWFAMEFVKVGLQLADVHISSMSSINTSACCFVPPLPDGFIPQTLCDDNDPLDVLVLMQSQVSPFSFLQVCV